MQETLKKFLRNANLAFSIQEKGSEREPWHTPWDACAQPLFAENCIFNGQRQKKSLQIEEL